MSSKPLKHKRLSIILIWVLSFFKKKLGKTDMVLEKKGSYFDAGLLRKSPLEFRRFSLSDLN